MNMKLVRTVKLRLQEDPKIFLPTIKAYTRAFNLVCQTGWNDKDFNGVSLHHKVYEQTREELPSQLAVSARMKATEALRACRNRLKKKKKTSCPESKQASIRYDARSYTVWFDRNKISLSTIDGRKTVKVIIPDYFRKYLSWRRTTAELFVRKDKVFLHIVFEKEREDPVSNGKFIGVDRGIRKLAVTSDKRFFGGGHVRQVSRRYQRLRSVLQSKGHSGKRHFRKIASKENRFRRDVNHVVSKRIVSSLEPGTTIVLEKLTGLKERTTKKRKKKDRYEHNSWSYYQFEEFLKYKAHAEGMDVAYVDARYTSRGCSRCGHVARSNRPHQSIFRCRKCSYQVNADLNAAFNIVHNFQNAIALQHASMTSHSGKGSQRSSCSPLSAA